MYFEDDIAAMARSIVLAQEQLDQRLGVRASRSLDFDQRRRRAAEVASFADAAGATLDP
ncbi:hypothetical protein ACFQE0_15685 [Methylobacterium komagatae]|uniref:Acyl-CoA dehydrogenase n=1 Tax=Methylobacterium komagatae TaxID=374425 RepID=A0ABW2BKG4_9HYPH